MALEVNTNHLFGFKGHSMWTEQALEGRSPDDIKAPFLLPRGGCVCSGLSGWLGRQCWEQPSTAPAPGIGRGRFPAPFRLRLPMESGGAASPTLLTWPFGHYRSQTGPQGIQYFADTEEDGPCSEGLEPIFLIIVFT